MATLMVKKIGLDTGFFVHLLRQHAGAVAVYEQIKKGQALGITSVVVVYELKKLSLQGIISRESARKTIKLMPRLFDVIMFDSLERADKVARLAHGNGLSVADAVILQAVLQSKAATIYTSDSDIETYQGDIEVINLGKT